MIQHYLDGLVKEAQKKEASAKLSSLSMDKLASIMGIKLAMTKCAGCGSEMHKRGGMLKCSACGMVKQAKPFTEQNRPEKVKDIYRALKRDHPGMPAEKKARIASRQGKPGKQKQGPPYKGPLTKASAAPKAPQRIEVGAPEGGGMPLQVVHRTAMAPLTPSEYRGEQVGRRVGAIGGLAAGGLAGGAVGAGLPAALMYLSQKLPLEKMNPTALGLGMTAQEIGGGLRAVPGAKGKLLRAALMAGGGTLGALGLGGLGTFLGRGVGGEVGQSVGAMGPTITKTQSVKTASIEKLSAPVRATYDLLTYYKGDVTKVAGVMLECGLDEDTAAAILKEAWAPWDVAKAGLGHAGRLLKGNAPGMAADAGLLSRVGQSARAAGGSMLQAGQMAAGAVPGKARQVMETYRGARGLGPGGMGPQTQAGKGIMGALGQTAMAHPGVAAGAAGLAGLGAGYAGKTALSSANAAALLQVGDAAGRLLAKTAAPPEEQSIGGVPVDELQESIQEAREREDPRLRAAQWARGGLFGGGLLGGGAGAGAGYGLARLLGRGPLGKGIGMGLGGLLGGAGGGILGGRLGAQHGMQEGQADALLQRLRDQQSMSSGYEEGGQEGYMAGLQHGRAGAENP